MSEINNNFEDLKRLLKLKRHEIPPPGYFHQFSGDVVARIRTGESGGGQNILERIQADSPYMAAVLQLFGAKPGCLERWPPASACCCWWGCCSWIARNRVHLPQRRYLRKRRRKSAQQPWPQQPLGTSRQRHHRQHESGVQFAAGQHTVWVAAEPAVPVRRLYPASQ